MFLCVAVFISLLLALARGGKWSNLSSFRFEKPWLVLAAIGMQAAIFNPVWDKYISAGSMTRWLYIFSILVLIIFVIFNRDIYGLCVLGTGVLLNSAAIIANNGYMPSSMTALKSILPPERIDLLYSGSASYNVVLITEHTRLKFLCDIFYIPNINVYSAGDILIAVGAFITIQQIMLNRNRDGVSITEKYHERGLKV